MSNSNGETAQAFQQACRFLSARALSETELSKKLNRKGYSSEAIQAASKRAKELKLLDDRDLAASVAEGLVGRGYGPARVRQKLRDRGMDEGLSEEILESAFAGEDLVAAAVRCGRRKNKALASKPLRNRKASVMRHLAGRGFPMEVVGRAIEEVYSDER